MQLVAENLILERGGRKWSMVFRFASRAAPRSCSRGRTARANRRFCGLWRAICAQRRAACASIGAGDGSRDERGVPFCRAPRRDQDAPDGGGEPRLLGDVPRRLRRDLARAGRGGAAAASRSMHWPTFPPDILSAGQKRRLALARLVAAERPLWLLDEPTVSLDAASIERADRGDQRAPCRAAAWR